MYGEMSKLRRWGLPFALSAVVGLGALSADQLLNKGGTIDSFQLFIDAHSKLPATTNAPAAAPAKSKPVIVIDPGHSGTDTCSTNGRQDYDFCRDPITKLIDHDYPTTPEISEMFSAAKLIEAKLILDGFQVILTKQQVNDTVNLRRRSQIAEDAHAMLGISLHDDHTQPSSFEGVYPQQVGLYRGVGANAVKFTNHETALRSQAAACAIITAREAGQGIRISNSMLNFENRLHIEPGNIAQVELNAPNVPWVYNEAGALNGINVQTYASAIAAGIEAAIPAMETAPTCQFNVNIVTR